VQFKSWLNLLSLPLESNKKLKTRNRTKHDELIKSGNGQKNPWDQSEKVTKTAVGRIYGEVSEVSPEWKRGVMHNESGDDNDDDDGELWHEMTVTGTRQQPVDKNNIVTS